MFFCGVSFETRRASHVACVIQDLFNAAFLTVWDELFMESWEGDNSHAPVIEAVQSALSSPSLPPEIQTQLLNLAGFMELQDKVSEVNGELG